MAIRRKTPIKRTVAAKKPARKPAIIKSAVSKKTVKKAAPVSKRAAAKRSTSKRSVRSSASKPKSNKLHHRAHHHVKKHIMRYFGGVAALFLITFVSQSGLSEAAQNKVSPTKAKKGYMIIFSQGGKYEGAIITTDGYGSAAGNEKRNCSGVSLNLNGVAPIQLTKKGKKITCDATDGSGRYTIAYDGGRSVVVDVDAGFCTYVHEDASKIRKVAASKSGGCGGADKNEVIVKENAKVNVKSAAADNKKGVSGFVEITGNNFKVNRSVCTGQVKIQVQDVTGKVIKTKTSPLRFVNDKKNPPYCVAKYNFGSLKEGLYTVTADYPGGKFFNPASGTGPKVILAKPSPLSR